MNIDNIKFDHFISEEAYENLQAEYFKKYGKLIESAEESMKIEELMKLKGVKSYGELKAEDFEEFENITSSSPKKDYFNDFIRDEIRELHSFYFNHFKKEIVKKALHTEDLIDGWYNTFNNELLENEKEIIKAEYLSMDIQLLLVEQINQLRESTEEFRKNPYPNIINKLQFNWNRTDVIYFFHLLRENKMISWIENADLGKIIDSAFEYTGNTDKAPKPITTSRKHLSDFMELTVSERSASKANERLKERFTKPDFFNH